MSAPRFRAMGSNLGSFIVHTVYHCACLLFRAYYSKGIKCESNGPGVVFYWKRNEKNYNKNEGIVSIPPSAPQKGTFHSNLNFGYNSPPYAESLHPNFEQQRIHAIFYRLHPTPRSSASIVSEK